MDLIIEAAVELEVVNWSERMCHPVPTPPHEENKKPLSWVAMAGCNQPLTRIPSQKMDDDRKEAEADVLRGSCFIMGSQG